MATQAIFHARVESSPSSRPGTPAARTIVSAAQIQLSVHEDLAAVEQDWRAFEQHADCTVFQTFDWLATWHRHIGTRNGVTPAIVVGRHNGDILFILPLAMEAGGVVRRVTWLGSYLCNYNGPLLAWDFPQRVSPKRFALLWHEIQKLLRSRLRHDLIDLEKMPEMVGNQVNPLLRLRVTTPHVNEAYLTHLTDTWVTFYNAKRSAATRKTDRKKRKRLEEHGEVRFVTAGHREEVVRSLDALIEHKERAYRNLGVANMFDWPGYRGFFLDMATNIQSRHLTHVSRLDVGAVTAAANFGLVFRDRYYYLLAGYNDEVEFARFGPGSAQLHELLRYSIGLGLKQFDFTIGDEPYKRDWCDTETKLFDQVSPASFRGWLVAMPMVALRFIKRSVKRSPTLWSAVRRVRALLGSIRR